MQAKNKRNANKRRSIKLQQILKINEKKFKFLSEKDEKGKRISEKIAKNKHEHFIV